MATKKYFFSHGSFSIKDGLEIRFWEDKWLGNATLREQYPALYNIMRYKGDTIATVMESFPPNVTFRRDLIGPRLQSWYILLQRLSTVQLSHGSDVFRWNLHGNGQFSVESMYRALIQSDVPVDNNKKIWKMKIPLRIKSLHSIFIAESFLLKITLLRGIGMEARNVYFVTMRRK